MVQQPVGVVQVPAQRVAVRIESSAYVRVG
jgi:hypothetical protein